MTSQNLLRTFSGLSQVFLITFSRHSELGTDCLGLVIYITYARNLLAMSGPCGCKTVSKQIEVEWEPISI